MSQGELDLSGSGKKGDGVPLPDLALDELRARMNALGVRRLLLKELAPNDNSKNQPYLSGSLDVTNILPSGEVYVDATPKGNRIMKAPLPLEWLQPDGTSMAAPDAKLILYPQYPEVRFSGFPSRRTQRALASSDHAHAGADPLLRHHRRPKDHRLVCRAGEQTCRRDCLAR